MAWIGDPAQCTCCGSNLPGALCFLPGYSRGTPSLTRTLGRAVLLCTEHAPVSTSQGNAEQMSYFQ